MSQVQSTSGLSEGERQLRIVHCKEFATKSVDRDLVLRADGSLDVYAAIEKSGYVSFEISSEGVRVRAGQHVGLVPINSRLAIRVTPRIPLQNLTQMVTDLDLELRHVLALRHYGDSPTLAGWMTDALTDAFLSSLEGLRDRGVQRQYVQRQETSSFPHGRLRLTETARLWSRGEKHKAAVSWFERTPQSPFNQALKGALLLCLSQYSAPDLRSRATSRQRIRLINTALRAFEEVRLPSGHEMTALAESVRHTPIPTNLDHYRQPVVLASKLLLGLGIDLESDAGVELRTSLLVDMGDLFEKYIRVALQNASLEGNWPLEIRDGNLVDVKVAMYEKATPEDLLRAPDRLPPLKANSLSTAMTPDIVVNGFDDETVLVADVKNKLAGEMPKRDDVEQVVAYAVRYRVDKALIIYPKNSGHTQGLQAVGRVGSVSVFQYHFDLDTQDLEAGKAQFSESVRRLSLLN